ncbi:MAG: hypothetical protein C5B56_13965 [Proteobacteria bacterium]|nr:MAG: hypothetical protein C5B56_13965 [Pseudomonadota bacterium]
MVAMINHESAHREGGLRAPWAKASIGADPDVVIEEFQQGLTIDLIATPRADFVTCGIDDMLPGLVERNRRQSFDFLPVTEPESRRIIGLLEIVSFMHGTAAPLSVREAMRPLSEENLIGADAGILAFVRDADRHRCRLVVSGHEISGLVCLSDLQQLPVRVALFGLITSLELMMAAVIRSEFPDRESWLARLPPGRQNKVGEEIDRARIRDGLVDDLLFANFADKIAILAESQHRVDASDGLEAELKEIKALRNELAHANDYAALPETANRTCARVRLMDKWIKEFSRRLRVPPS